MRQEVIEIPSKVINFARIVNPDNPKKLVRTLFELSIAQTLELGAPMLSEDQIIIENFPHASNEFVSKVVRWFLNNDADFLLLINRYGIGRVNFNYEDNDSDNSFLMSSLMVINIKE